MRLLSMCCNCLKPRSVTFVIEGAGVPLRKDTPAFCFHIPAEYIFLAFLWKANKPPPMAHIPADT